MTAGCSPCVGGEGSGGDNGRLADVEMYNGAIFRHAPARWGAAIPDMQLMADGFVEKNPAEMAIVVEEGIGVANGQDDVHLAQFKPPRTGRDPEGNASGVKVNRVVVITAEQVAKTF